MPRKKTVVTLPLPANETTVEMRTLEELLDEIRLLLHTRRTEYAAAIEQIDRMINALPAAGSAAMVPGKRRPGRPTNAELQARKRIG